MIVCAPENYELDDRFNSYFIFNWEAEKTSHLIL